MEKKTIQRAVLTYRKERLRGIWKKVKSRLSINPVHRRLLILKLPFTEDLPVIEPKAPVTFEELNPSDWGELIALRPYLTEEVIRLRLQAGHRFYVAKLNGRIVHNRLVAINKAYSGYLRTAFPLSSDEVYFGEAYTVPKHRRKRLHSACLSFVSRAMFQLGYQHAVAFVHPRNSAALRSLSKVGFQKKGQIGFVEIFGTGRYFYWAKDGLDCLNNALLVPREKLVPPQLQGEIW